LCEIILRLLPATFPAMRHRLYSFSCLFFSATLMIGALPVSVQSSDLVPGWQQAKSYLYADAQKTFAAASGQAGVNERERSLGEAISLINVQPKTQNTIQRARFLLERVVQENDSDHAGILARYMTGRILEFHQQTPDPQGASAIYRSLVENHPGNPVAEFAASALATVELYAPLSSEERAAKLRELEEIGPRLQTPAGRRDFHLALGAASLALMNEPESTLKHLILADQNGITRPETESAVWIQIGEIARRQGHAEIATEYYQKFLAKYLRNNASYTIRKRLEALQP
jgi:tetratricopeptide (TPR) repeat protein